MDRRALFSQRDLPLVGLLLVLAGGVFFLCQASESAGVYAEIRAGDVRTLLPLGEARTYPVPGQPDVVIAVRGGTAAFEHSDCPDQICVKTGALSLPGQSAACLPNRVTLRILGDAPGAVDTVAH